jgi:hypothetical protein
MGKESTKTMKAEKSTTAVNQDKEKDVKQTKSKKTSREQLSGEKKNDPSPPKTPGGRRLSKADARGTYSRVFTEHETTWASRDMKLSCSHNSPTKMLITNFNMWPV